MRSAGMDRRLRAQLHGLPRGWPHVHRLPDLNYTVALGNAPLFKAIVIDGALRENGMMPFNKSLSAQDAEAIRSYLTYRANDLKKNPPRGCGPPGGAPPPAPPAPPAPAGRP
jgi:hypothetical protein